MTEQSKRSFKARKELEAAPFCGCYYCLEFFHVSEIKEWADGNETAICPKCGIDSVVAYRTDIDESRIHFYTRLVIWKKESFS